MNPMRVPLMGHEFTGRDGIQRYLLYHLCYVSQRVRLLREPDNPRDRNAVVALAETIDGRLLDLGYIPRRYAGQLSAELVSGRIIDATIAEIRPDLKDPRKTIIVVDIFEVRSELESATQRPIRLAPQPLPVPESITTPTPNSVPRRKAQGVSGWLAFFCVSRGILAPLYFLGRNELSSPLTLMQWVGVGDCTANVLIVLLLWNRRPIALSLLKTYFIVVFSVSGAAIVLLLLARQSVSSGLAEDAASVVFRLAFQVVSQLVWYAYFARSKRVREVYGRNM